MGTVQPELEKCEIKYSGNEGFVNSTDIDPEILRLAALHNLQIDCIWIIEVAEGWKVYNSFLIFLTVFIFILN